MLENMKLKQWARQTALVLAVFGVLVATAVAQGIVAPVHASTTLRTPFARGSGGLGNIAYVADRSGLSNPYTVGVDEFDSFVATVHHNNSTSSMLLGNSNGRNQPNGIVNLGETITLDLGSVRAIDAIGLWTSGVGSEAITALRLHADDDASFANGTVSLLGNFAPAVILAGQAFSFNPVATRFVHLEVTGHGGGSFLNLGEIAFRDAGLHMTFASGLQIAPGSSTAINFHAPQSSGQFYLPIVSCTLGSTSVAGLPSPLPIALDACSDLYLSEPLGQSIFALTSKGALFEPLDAAGRATGSITIPSTIPSGLGLPLHFCFFTFNPSGATLPQVSPLGTLTLN